MSTVVVNSGSGGSGGGSSSGEGGGGKGKKNDWMVTAALLGGAAVVGYIGSLMLAKKFGLSVPNQSVPSDLDSLLAPPPSTTPTPDQSAGIPPTPVMPAGSTTYYPPMQNFQTQNLPNIYQQYPGLGLTSTIPFTGDRPPTGNLYPPNYPNLNSLYPYQVPVAATVTNAFPARAFLGETKHRWRGPNMGFENKEQGEYDHGHRHGSEHDHNKNYEEIGDEYLTDTEDLELSVEEPYLHEIYGVNAHNADMADFDDMAFAEEDQAMTEEEMDVHVHSAETDYNDGNWGYAGHGVRHKHTDKGDRQNLRGEDYRPSHFHMDMQGMGNEFKTRLVRDHHGKLMGLAGGDE